MACCRCVQESKGRDVLPILASGKRMLKESTERVTDKRLSLADMSGVEYTVALKRDHVRSVVDANDGTTHAHTQTSIHTYIHAYIQTCPQRIHAHTCTALR